MPERNKSHVSGYGAIPYYIVLAVGVWMMIQGAIWMVMDRASPPPCLPCACDPLTQCGGVLTYNPDTTPDHCPTTCDCRDTPCR